MSDLPPLHRHHVARDASPAEVYAVVTDFASYPRLFPEFSSARVLASEGNRTRVEFKLPMLIPVRYVLDLVCDAGALAVDWTLAESDVVTTNHGSWRFSPEGSGTRLDYRVTLAVKAPFPGFVVRKVTDALVSASLPAMFAAIEREVVRRRSPAR